MKKFIFFFFLTINTIILAQNYNYDIKFHRLNFETDPSVRYIKGFVTTYFQPLSDYFNQISFDLSDALIVDSIIFENQKISFSHSNETLTAELPKTLTQSQIDSITVFYHGIPENYESFTTGYHNDTVPVMWTLSEPYGAKDWWPCKQQLNDKADSIELIISCPLQYSVAANGLITKIDTIDNKKITVWKHRYPITAYLVAFAVTNYSTYFDYATINDTLQIPVMNMVYPEDEDYAKIQTPETAKALEFYSKKFIPYPFAGEKYGHAEFGWSGGMEHQTMTFVGLFRYDILVHELAHQWFGDYITCASWHDIWLNEGFAVYLEGLTAEAGLAPYSWNDWKTETIKKATLYDTGSVYVQDTTSVSRIFNYYLTYMKGGMILHQLRYIVGDSAFFSAMNNYLNDPKLAYSYATVDDFKQHVENACNCNLDYYFDQWYYGSGFPYYDIYWWQDSETGNLQILVYQTPSNPDAGYFELPLEFKISGLKNDTIIRVDNFTSGQGYSVNTGFWVSNVEFDPNHNIITKNARISYVNINNEDFMRIAPNPVDEQLNIILAQATFIKEVAVFGTNGKLQIMQPQNKTTNLLSVDTKQLPPGNYIATVFCDNEKYSKKFVVKR